MKYLLLMFTFLFTQTTFAEGGSCLHHSIETNELTSCWYYQPEFNYNKYTKTSCLKHNEREGEKFTKAKWSNETCPTKKLVSVCHATNKYEPHNHTYKHKESNKTRIYGSFCLPERKSKVFNNEFYKSVKVAEVVKKKKNKKRKPNITAKSEGFDVLLQINEIRKVSKLLETYKATKGKKSMTMSALNSLSGGDKIRKIKKETAQSILTSLEKCIRKNRISFDEEVSKDDCPIVHTQKKLPKKGGWLTEFKLSDKKLIDLFGAYSYECKESAIDKKSGNKSVNIDCSISSKDFGNIKIDYKGVNHNYKAEKWQDRKKVETYDISYNEKKLNYIVEHEYIKLSKITLNGMTEKFGYSMSDKRLKLLPTDLLLARFGRL